MSELKLAKDSLVSSLYELSKIANETANAAINFYNASSSDPQGEQLISLSNALKSIVDATHAVDAASNGNKSGLIKSEDKPKKKVEKDPNAPKKPLTIYFQFSFETRKIISEDRKRKGLPSLSAIDMNELIREKWANITPEEKAKWQRKYAVELKDYQKEKEDYKTSKELSDKIPVAIAKKAEELVKSGNAEQPQQSESESSDDSSDDSSDSEPEHKIQEANKKKDKKRKGDKAERRAEKKAKKEKNQLKTIL